MSIPGMAYKCAMKLYERV